MGKLAVSEVLFLYGMLNLISGALLYSEALGIGLGGRQWNRGRPDPPMKWPFIMNAIFGAASVLGSLLVRDELTAEAFSAEACAVALGIRIQIGWSLAAVAFWSWRIYALIPVFHLKQYALVFYAIDVGMSICLLAFLICRLPAKAKPATAAPPPSTAAAAAATAALPAATAETKKDQ